MAFECTETSKGLYQSLFEKLDSFFLFLKINLFQKENRAPTGEAALYSVLKEHFFGSSECCFLGKGREANGKKLERGNLAKNSERCCPRCLWKRRLPELQYMGSMIPISMAGPLIFKKSKLNLAATYDYFHGMKLETWNTYLRPWFRISPGGAEKGREEDPVIPNL